MPVACGARGLLWRPFMPVAYGARGLRVAVPPVELGIAGAVPVLAQGPAADAEALGGVADVVVLFLEHSGEQPAVHDAMELVVLDLADHGGERRLVGRSTGRGSLGGGVPKDRSGRSGSVAGGPLAVGWWSAEDRRDELIDAEADEARQLLHLHVADE